VPGEFLRGLRGVFLLGGTRKQAKTAWGRLFRFGSYSCGMIFLHPMPRAMTEQHYRRLPKPSDTRPYRRAGCRFLRAAGGWVCLNRAVAPYGVAQSAGQFAVGCSGVEADVAKRLPTALCPAFMPLCPFRLVVRQDRRFRYPS